MRARVREAGPRGCRSPSPAPSSRWAPCSPARRWRRWPPRWSTSTLLYLGLNCATGPEFMTDHIRSLAQLTRVPGRLRPQRRAARRERPLPRDAGDDGPRPCGASPRRAGSTWSAAAAAPRRSTSQAIAEAVAGHPPPRRRSLAASRASRASTTSRSPRTSARSSSASGPTSSAARKFKELIVAEKCDDAAEIARAQVKRGAQIIDVCLANPDRDELGGHASASSSSVIKKVRVPLMIDSTDEKVIELALTYCQGKAIINSVNLEDGEERFEKVVPAGPPLRRRAGRRLHRRDRDGGDPGRASWRSPRAATTLLTEKYGIPEEDLYFDPLVFPCASGDQQYVGSAVETIEGVRAHQAALPRVARRCSASPTSPSACPPPGREVLNSVFLYHCVQAGLRPGPGQLREAGALPARSRTRSGSSPRTSSSTAAPTPSPPSPRTSASASRRRPGGAEHLPLDERLPRYIIEGSRDGLLADLDAGAADAASRWRSSTAR